MGVGSNGEVTFNGNAYFTGNSAGLSGGAIYNFGTVVFTNIGVFKANEATSGFIVYCANKVLHCPAI